jgi:16S rRNA C967 or C1407 C5-methylase (RsmB/RsmF family)
VLQKEAGNIQTVPIDIEGLSLQPALTSWGEKTYDPQVANCVRIYPNKLMEGFFVAKFIKVKSSVPTALQ